MDCERMHAPAELIGERLIDQTVTLDPGLPFEVAGHDIHPEMRRSPGPMSGVPCMQVRFVDDAKTLGGESPGQFIRNDFGGAHTAGA